jgi:hypothetical protein
MANRKAFENYVLKYVERIAPRSSNVKLLTNIYRSMSDAEFESYVANLEAEREFICMTIPNFIDAGVSVTNNLAIAEEIGHEFFEQIWIEGQEDEPTHLTPIPYMVVDFPLKRASQLLTKKISVPENNKIVDTLSGQPTGDSKGAKISYPELQVSAAMGLDATMTELMKYRGGDNKGMNAYNAMLSKLGTASMDKLSNYASGVESTKTLKTFLTAAMLRTTL